MVAIFLLGTSPAIHERVSLFLGEDFGLRSSIHEEWQW